MAVPCLGLRQGWGDVKPVGWQDLNPGGFLTPGFRADVGHCHLHGGMERNHNFSLLLLLLCQCGSLQIL